MNSYLYRFRVIHFQNFKGLTLTFDVWRSSGVEKLYYLKAHIWLSIWLLWTPSLHVVPFSIYSTSKCLGFDLDLRPLKVIWCQKNSYHSKALIWHSNWLLWTPSLYLVPFSRYSTSKFSGFDLDLWPLKVIWGRKIVYYSNAHIWLPISLLWTTSLLSCAVFEIFNFKVFRAWRWPLTHEGHLMSKKIKPSESPFTTSYLTSMDNISPSRTVFEIFDSQVFRVRPWPLTPKSHLGSKNLFPSKAHIWLPIWLLWTTSLLHVPFSRYSTSKFLGFDLDLWPLKVIWFQTFL